MHIILKPYRAVFIKSTVKWASLTCPKHRTRNSSALLIPLESRTTTSHPLLPKCRLRRIQFAVARIHHLCVCVCTTIDIHMRSFFFFFFEMSHIPNPNLRNKHKFVTGPKCNAVKAHIFYVSTRASLWPQVIKHYARSWSNIEGSGSS